MNYVPLCHDFRNTRESPVCKLLHYLIQWPSLFLLRCHCRVLPAKCHGERAGGGGSPGGEGAAGHAGVGGFHIEVGGGGGLGVERTRDGEVFSRRGGAGCSLRAWRELARSPIAADGEVAQVRFQQAVDEHGPRIDFKKPIAFTLDRAAGCHCHRAGGAGGQQLHRAGGVGGVAHDEDAAAVHGQGAGRGVGIGPFGFDEEAASRRSLGDVGAAAADPHAVAGDGEAAALVAQGAAAGHGQCASGGGGPGGEGAANHVEVVGGGGGLGVERTSDGEDFSRRGGAGCSHRAWRELARSPIAADGEVANGVQRAVDEHSPRIDFKKPVAVALDRAAHCHRADGAGGQQLHRAGGVGGVAHDEDAAAVHGQGAGRGVGIGPLGFDEEAAGRRSLGDVGAAAADPHAVAGDGEVAALVAQGAAAGHGERASGGGGLGGEGAAGHSGVGGFHIEVGGGGGLGVERASDGEVAARLSDAGCSHRAWRELARC